jgi:hypothetical protein
MLFNIAGKCGSERESVLACYSLLMLGDVRNSAVRFGKRACEQMHGVPLVSLLALCTLVSTCVLEIKQIGCVSLMRRIQQPVASRLRK